MKEPTNKLYLKIILFLFSGLALGHLYTRYIRSQDSSIPAERVSSSSVSPEKSGDFIRVSIRGAVAKPGIFKLKQGSRLEDLIRAAGGYREGAQKEIKNYYLKNNTEFTIKYRKKIKVSISGEVAAPGEYEMFWGDRLYDLIRKAGGLTAQGWMPENFFLKERKKWYVPRKIRVSIRGEVNRPGEYEMKAGSRLSDLVKSAGGMTSSGTFPKKDYYLKEGKSYFIPKNF